MLSFHASKRISPAEETLSKKRKRDEEKEKIIDEDKAKSMKYFLAEADPLAHTPLPSDWQRCLDVKSGQVYFLNTRTRQRAFTHPRSSAGPSPSPTPMSLDLELNLPSQCLRNNRIQTRSSEARVVIPGSVMRLNRSPSWLSFEADEQEMVTAVCSRCYMLVMMCKSSPSCPNCKYMHPMGTRES